MRGAGASGAGARGIGERGIGERGIGAGGDPGNRPVDLAQALDDLADQRGAEPAAAAQRRQDAFEAGDQRREGFGQGEGRAGHFCMLVLFTCMGKKK